MTSPTHSVLPISAIQIRVVIALLVMTSATVAQPATRPVFSEDFEAFDPKRWSTIKDDKTIEIVDGGRIGRKCVQNHRDDGPGHRRLALQDAGRRIGDTAEIIAEVPRTLAVTEIPTEHPHELPVDRRVQVPLPDLRRFDTLLSSHPLQGEADVRLERLIKLLTYRRDLVIDPYNGSGMTTAVVKRRERRYIGIDQSPKHCSFARTRLLSANGEKEMPAGRATK